MGDGSTQVGYHPLSYTYDSPGDYTVELSVFDGHCRDTARHTLLVHPESWVGLNNKKERDFTIYPNPVVNELNLQLDTYEFDKISIIDMSGRKHKVHFTQGGKQKIDVTHLPKGQYVLNVLVDNKMLSSKFIKE